MMIKMIHLLAIATIAMQGTVAHAQEENQDSTTNISKESTLNEYLLQLGSLAEKLDDPRNEDVSKILEAIPNIADRIVILGSENLSEREGKKLRKIVEKLKSNTKKALETEGKQKPLLKKVRAGLRRLETLFTDTPNTKERDRHGFRYPRHRNH